MVVTFVVVGMIVGMPVVVTFVIVGFVGMGFVFGGIRAGICRGMRIVFEGVSRTQ